MQWWVCGVPGIKAQRTDRLSYKLLPDKRFGLRVIDIVPEDIVQR